MLLKYGTDSAFIGGYYIFPQYRQLGIGSRLFTELIKQSNTQNINIGLFSG
jgi:ribosomal protein S18 acetylase RimI-like enzyme